jgi:hypothetical protein
MDDLAILVIILLIASAIFYVIGHQYWWLILLVGGVIFVIIMYFVGASYYPTIAGVNDSVAELQQLKQSLLTQANVNKLITKI